MVLFKSVDKTKLSSPLYEISQSLFKLCFLNARFPYKHIEDVPVSFACSEYHRFKTSLFLTSSSQSCPYTVDTCTHCVPTFIIEPVLNAFCFIHLLNDSDTV